MALKKSADAKALVFFTPYRPWLLEKDLAFFDLAREAGFKVDKLLEKVMDRVMFDDDPGVSNNLLQYADLLDSHAVIIGRVAEEDSLRVSIELGITVVVASQ